MTLPSSGTITIEMIQGEFGGPTSPYSIANYYRGGSYVPNTSENASIPTSGPITFSDFYGTSAFSSQLITFTSGSGTVTVPNGAGHVTIEVWGGGSSGTAGYVVSGKPAGGDGGGAGGYCRSVYSCSGGETISYSVGPGGIYIGAGTNSTASSGTLSITTMTGVGPGAPGGGAASGGNVTNVTGGSGTIGGVGTIGYGGAAVSGVYAGPAGGGGRSGVGTSPGTSGGNGLVSFYFTT